MATPTLLTTTLNKLFEYDAYLAFLTAYFCLNVIESIIIALLPYDSLFIGAIVIIGLSICCWIINYLVVTTSMNIPTNPAIINLLETSRAIVFYEALDYYSLIDAAFSIFGIVALFLLPGIASLRVLRIFTFVKYGKYITDDGKSSLARYGLRSIKVCDDFLTKVASEFCTTKTKGAVVLLGMFFYFAYVFGIAFWLHTKDDGNEFCETADSCVITMIRLAFYDNKGLDFLASFANSSSKVLTALLIFYLIVTGIIILNGLIGIFGGMFISFGSQNGSTTGSYILAEDESVKNIEEMLKTFLKDNNALGNDLAMIKEDLATIKNLRAAEKTKEKMFAAVKQE